MRTVAIIQARMDSQRLPGKVLMPLAGRPLLQFLLERIRRANSLDDIVVATGNVPSNQAIIELVQALGVNYFVGSEEDVLDRFIRAAQYCKAKIVVRITADNPLIDPRVIDALVEERTATDADFTMGYDIIDGANLEVVTYKALVLSQRMAATPTHREHPTSFIRDRPDIFRVVYWKAPKELRRPDLSVSVDTPVELKMVQALCADLENTGPTYPWSKVIEWLELHRDTSSVSKSRIGFAAIKTIHHEG